MSVRAHAQVLAVHGVCHLMGHDHETDADYALMKPMEEEMLRVALAVGTTAAEPEATTTGAAAAAAEEAGTAEAPGPAAAAAADAPPPARLRRRRGLRDRSAR